MTIVKGYLRRQFTINKQWLIVGITIGTVFSYVLYKFSYYLREIFRILTYHLGERVLIELSPKEHFYYNLFYGSISAILGIYITVTFCIENSIVIRKKYSRIGHRAILNEQRFFLWSFMNAFVRMAMVIGFMFITVPLQFEIDFLKDFSLLLILIPTVLFLNIWPTFLRMVGNKGYKWVFISLIYVIGFSAIYGNVNFSNFQKTTENLRKSDVVYTYQIQVPSTQSFQRIPQPHLTTDIYLVIDSSNLNSPILFVDNMHTRIGLNDIVLHIARERDRLPKSQRNKIIPNLFIDQYTKLAVVNKLKHELNKSYIRTIQYSTTVKNSKYPPTHPQFKYIGLQYNLDPVYHSSFKDFLDSIENLNLKKYTLRLPESSLYRIHEIKNSKFIKITVMPENAFLNGKPIADEELQDILYRFIKAHSPNYHIVYDPDEEITFGRYIHYLDMMYSAIDRLRNEMSIGMYGEPYEDISIYSFVDYSKSAYTVKNKYPRSIIELSTEEKRLLEVIKKTGYVR